MNNWSHLTNDRLRRKTVRASSSMAKSKIDIARLWGFADPREIPAYSTAEAAHYLCMPQQTVRAWVYGTSYGQRGHKRRFKPVIQLPVPDTLLLSFFNLAEVHVLRALRTKHEIKLPLIRKALDFVNERFGWERPLLQQDFKTDGVRLFVDHLGKLVEASAGGQTMMQEVMAHLERLDWEDNIVARLYPFTRPSPLNAPKSVIIDPRHSFGRPILAEARIATAVIAQRYKAGESVHSLADDYGCDHLEIEEGIRCELRLSAAA
jgi:uncharacterized protein (DUF433 family)